MTLARTLLAWYDAHRRDLPWRRRSDPYAVWVSEIMLQQTRVETVLRYYEPFLARFPTVERLAMAEQDEILASWSGLGYYRRARNLHRAAREIVAAGGRLPNTATEWRRLPGIGEYTAAAIASIAHGEPVPVLDGNVERVLARRLALEGDPKQAANRQKLLRAAGELLTAERPGDSNQAMMELGATVCTPRAPTCLLCPLSGGCRARQAGQPEFYPPPRKRPATVKQRRLVAVVTDDDRFLLYRRAGSERLLAETWELPWVESDAEEHAAEALSRRYGGGTWTLGESLGTARHSITNRSITADVHRATLDAAPDELADGPSAAWLTNSEIAERPVSSLVGKALAIWFRSRG